MHEIQKRKTNQWIQTPLQIGNRTIDSRLVFAPMSGLGHVAFRELLSDYGHYGLLFSEMSSAKAIPHENRHVSPVFRWRDCERHQLVWQLLGNSPKDMAKAAQRIAREEFFGVDINMSCSAARIYKRGMGACLLKYKDQALDIVRSVRDAVDIPLFVKFRTGWLDKSSRLKLEPSNLVDQAIEFACRLEECGVDAVTFHPRVAPDRRTRPPKWSHIAKVKQAVNIPVFGNGNVFDDNDCEKIYSETACDGISLGRIALAKPWIFAELKGVFQPDDSTYPTTIFRYMDLLEKHYNPQQAMKRLIKFSKYFCAGFQFGNALRSNIKKAQNFDNIRRVYGQFFDSPVLLNTRPNENLFV